MTHPTHQIADGTHSAFIGRCHATGARRKMPEPGLGEKNVLLAGTTSPASAIAVRVSSVGAGSANSNPAVRVARRTESLDRGPGQHDGGACRQPVEHAVVEQRDVQAR